MFTSRPSRSAALLQHVDQLIAKYEPTNPELVKELRAHRDKLQEYTYRGNATEMGKTLLRISVWVKFIMDQWPD